MNKAQLWERKTDQIVSAELFPEMTPEQVVQTGEHWQRFRVQARERLRRERASVPEHDHWNWDEKSHYLKFTAYRCLGIRYDDEVQGLMMISTLAVEGRLPIHKGKPVLYVKYIESAPWNLKGYMGAEARFGGIGISLIRAAIANIKAREVAIFGSVRGNVEVTEKIAIREQGSLIGDIKSAGISIDDGAYFKGSIDIVRPEPKATRKGVQSEPRMEAHAG